ncbi:MAG: 4-phosphoerythronate dehydrogenase [Kangiellaceae bacterium]|nr:4-phosphoerythronate dehydrogenase [Kangiellaceae bacterium]
MPLVEDLFGHLGSIHRVAGRNISANDVQDANILLVRSITQVNSELLNGSSVRFVGSATIGTDHIDQDYLAKNNIGFAYAPGCNAQAVAEYVLCAIAYWAEKRNRDVSRIRVGIIGAGNVGSKLAKVLDALSIDYVLSDPPLQQAGDRRSFVSLDEIQACDVISCHVPLTYDQADATYHLLDQSFLDGLKDNCLLINSSRGAVLDNQAALNAKILAEIDNRRLDIVLDVWENEPDLDVHLLDKCLLATPHIAGYSLAGKVRGSFMLYQAVCHWFDKAEVHKLVDYLPRNNHWPLNLRALKQLKKYYDISADDQALRQVKQYLPQSFDKLRKEYPTRHEFIDFSNII